MGLKTQLYPYIKSVRFVLTARVSDVALGPESRVEFFYHQGETLHHSFRVSPYLEAYSRVTIVCS